MWSEILAVGSYTCESRICLPCRTLPGVDLPALCSLRLGLGVDGTCVMVAGSTVGGAGRFFFQISNTYFLGTENVPSQPLAIFAFIGH